jgi:hypothetical protein
VRAPPGRHPRRGRPGVRLQAAVRRFNPLKGRLEAELLETAGLSSLPARPRFGPPNQTFAAAFLPTSLDATPSATQLMTTPQSTPDSSHLFFLASLQPNRFDNRSIPK